MAKVPKPSPKNSLLIVILVVVLMISGGVSYYFYNKYQESQKLLKNPNAAAQAEIDSLVSRVGKIIELPKDETPTIATVSDISKLKNQPFFAHAKNGFKVFLYQKAKKAIMYDPGANKIIEVQPLSIGDSSQQAPEFKVALYNGTTTVGLTNTIEKKLKEKITNISITDKENASKTTYTKTIVVDLTGKQSASAQAIAKTLNGTVEKLPEGEKKPEGVDFLVILGASQ